MSECNEYIQRIYESPKIIEFISRIEPADLQDDLRQEMAIVLLNYDCFKLAAMHHRGELIQFAMGILWKMGRLQKGEFYKIFRQSNRDKLREYMRQGAKDNSDELAKLANGILSEKLMQDANAAHEAIIFRKYAELGTCKKVAEYFGIPKHHVDKVVNKCRQELKKAIKQKI
jgi:hypothetical protein